MFDFYSPVREALAVSSPQTRRSTGIDRCCVRHPRRLDHVGIGAGSNLPNTPSRARRKQFSTATPPLRGKVVKATVRVASDADPGRHWSNAILMGSTMPNRIVQILAVLCLSALAADAGDNDAIKNAGGKIRVLGSGVSVEFNLTARELDDAGLAARFEKEAVNVRRGKPG